MGAKNYVWESYDSINPMPISTNETQYSIGIADEYGFVMGQI